MALSKDGSLKDSGIILLKSKFFIYRIIYYFSFLLIPIWIQKTQTLNQSVQCLMMVLYIGFMVGQWFLLGKEIDYRLKIYFRVNSSIDRVIYRMFLGMIFIVIYFNLLSFLPSKWIYNLFWVTWVILGLFYSWPTRGKIIRESVSSNFSEFKYLDSFEKTLLGLIIIMFFVSVPQLPKLVNMEALKLYFDPGEKFSMQLWNFLTVNYYPFKKYPKLFKLAWCMHFYFVGMGAFLLAFYGLLRYFVSRRLSILGVFALLSSWSFSKILSLHYGSSFSTTYSVIWIWTLLWVTKSSTYRAGLFLGLFGYWSVLINQSYGILSWVQIIFLYTLFLSQKTPWFKRQVIKYALLGFVLSLFTFIFQYDNFSNIFLAKTSLWGNIVSLVNRKAFYSLAPLGIIGLLLKAFFPNIAFIKMIYIEKKRIVQLVISLLTIFIFSLIVDNSLIQSFALMWPITFFSLIPLELIFQSISRLRSNRNMIYLVYIIICLLDSHFEGRIKIFLKMFNS